MDDKTKETRLQELLQDFYGRLGSDPPLLFPVEPARSLHKQLVYVLSNHMYACCCYDCSYHSISTWMPT